MQQQQQRWNTFAPFPMNRNVNSWMNNQMPSIPSIPAQNNVRLFSEIFTRKINVT